MNIGVCKTKLHTVSLFQLLVNGDEEALVLLLKDSKISPIKIGIPEYNVKVKLQLQKQVVSALPPNQYCTCTRDSSAGPNTCVL